MFDPTLPDGSTQGVLFVPLSVRNNAVAIVDALVLWGAVDGYNVSTTGDDEEPTTVLYDNGVNQVRLTPTWGTASTVDSVLYEANRGGAGWETIGTLTVSYDADYNVTGTSWS